MESINRAEGQAEAVRLNAQASASYVELLSNSIKSHAPHSSGKKKPDFNPLEGEEREERGGGRNYGILK